LIKIEEDCLTHLKW